MSCAKPTRPSASADRDAAVPARPDATRAHSPSRILALRPAMRRYDRARDLARLVPLWPSEIADTSLAGRERLVARLRRALRQERRRGLAGHWTYDLARHHQLIAAFRMEVAALVAARHAARRAQNQDG